MSEKRPGTSVAPGGMGALRESYALYDIRLERAGYLSLFSFAVDGFPFRHEVLDRGQDAAIVLPVDWERRVVYLIRQPRLARALTPALLRAVRNLASAIAAGAMGERVAVTEAHVPGEDVHVLEAPAGMIDSGETASQAAVRELEEEAGFVIDEAGLTLVSEHTVSAGCSTERHVCFLANVTAQTPCRPPSGDGTERMETVALSFDEAYALLMRQHVDGASLATLLREVRIRDLEAQLREAQASLTQGEEE